MSGPLRTCPRCRVASVGTAENRCVSCGWNLDVLGRFAAHLADRTRSPRSIAAYCADLRHLARFLAGEIGGGSAVAGSSDKLLTEMTPAEVSAFLAYWGRMHYSAGSIARKSVAIRQYVAWRLVPGAAPAAEWAAALKHPQAPKDTSLKLTPADVRTIRASAPATMAEGRSRLAALLVLTLGLRADDLVRIDVVDFARLQIVVRRPRRVRMLQSTAELHDEVQAYGDQVAARGLDGRSPALLVGCRGERIGDRSLRRTMLDFGRRLELSVPLTPRSLRATHRDNALTGGEPAESVADRLGLVSAASLRRLCHRRTRKAVA